MKGKGETSELNQLPASPPSRATTTANMDMIPSSSPAFASPVHPIRLRPAQSNLSKTSVLPISLPPPTLRPLAFRIFTKKHNLILTSTALQVLATFIGKHCGAGWRHEGLAERALDELAKTLKKNSGNAIIDGDSKEFGEAILRLEGCMSGGRIVSTSSSRGSSTLQPTEIRSDDRSLSLEDTHDAPGPSIPGEVRGECNCKDPRKWLKVVGAFGQPRLAYNADRRQFEKQGPPSLFPDPSHKTRLFRQRYNLIHQRLLRNESFQVPAILHSRAHSLQRSTSSLTAQEAYKLTPIANLLGRSGSKHVLLGLLTVSPTGKLAISDLTGSIALDLSHAQPVPENGAWFAPGMIVIVEGIYEEEGSAANASDLGGGGGVGGTIGGKFFSLSVGGPPCERRDVTLGRKDLNDEHDVGSGSGFGWVDFLGVGSERVAGLAMRKLEAEVLGKVPAINERNKIVIIGEVHLDNPETVQALKKVFSFHAAQPASASPITFVLVGNFITHAAMAGGNSDSIEYKEAFDSLAFMLAEYPTLLQAAAFVFVPGDNDPWQSSFSSGAAAMLPRNGVPDFFTSRTKRAFAAANAEPERSADDELPGEAIWTTNPARLSLFGPAQEIVVFRDDISSRLRRNAIRFRSPDHTARNEAGAEGSNETQLATEEGVESVDVDEAVVDAESHLPKSKSRDEQGELETDTLTARKLVKTILDQGYLSPFPLSKRPVLWDYAGALQLYPLPTALILVDPETTPFAVTYEGCHVMNPGRLVVESRKGLARWMEYDIKVKRGVSRVVAF